MHTARMPHSVQIRVGLDFCRALAYLSEGIGSSFSEFRVSSEAMTLNAQIPAKM